MSSLSDLEKAHILYNHIWHSGLHNDYIEELYRERRYRSIISHANFNPRLISYVTDASRLDGCLPEDYWTHITRSLSNPSQIWENPFTAQQDDFGRAIVFLVVFNGRSISEHDLGVAYNRFIALPENQGLKGRQDFQTVLRTLTGSFLNRTVTTTGDSSIDLFNPSIGDFVLSRYSKDASMFKKGALSLFTLHALNTLKSLNQNKVLSDVDLFRICEVVLRCVSVDDYAEVNYFYMSALCEIILTSTNSKEPRLREILSKALTYFLTDSNPYTNHVSFNAVRLGLERNLLSEEQAINFVRVNIEYVAHEDEIESALSVLRAVNEAHPEYAEIIGALSDHVIEMFIEKFTDFIETSEAFLESDWEDADAAERKLVRMIEDKLDTFGFTANSFQIGRMFLHYDVESELQSFLVNNHYDDDDRLDHGPEALASDEIDDLFDRN
jgi:hypothetical protein